MKILIYIPTYNTAKTLEETVKGIPENLAKTSDYIVVDNGSTDNSVEEAERLGFQVIRHHHNRGYGGSQKTAYTYALGSKADIVVMLHSDNQYDPSLLNDILNPIINDEADVVFGSRILGGKALEGGMPLYKYKANRFLTGIENKILKSNISEFHSGYRAYRVDALRKIPFLFNSDNWLFDSEIIFQVVQGGFRIKEIPIPTIYHSSASSVSFYDGCVYGLSIFLLIARYMLHHKKILRRKQFAFTNH